MKQLQNMTADVIDQVNQVVYGKENEIREMMAAFIGGGHILLEDIPGVGKTTLAVAFSRAIRLEYRRVQFTPDVLPSDLTGFSIYRREKEEFVYQPGSVFCNLLLADELNRTSPKTQSALLEVMEERKVTVEGITRSVPSPFLVIATQNPFGNAGTQLIPDAQIDRFMVSLSIGYPGYESELEMAKDADGSRRLDRVRPVMDGGTLLRIQEEAGDVYIHEKVYRYILDLVRATREHPAIEQGGSPRATIALVRMSRAWAWLSGRAFVTPEDVIGQYAYIISHRIRLYPAAKMDRTTKETVIGQILDSVKKPPLT